MGARDITVLAEAGADPKLYGVRYPAFAGVSGSDLDKWATEHPNVGLPLIGTPSSRSCSVDPAECAAALGQFCVGGRCREYPIVTADGRLTFTGAGVWDPTANIRFRPVKDDTDIDEFNAAVKASLGSLTDGRCDEAPVAQGAEPVNPHENSVETVSIADPTFNLAPGRFYRVQVVNENGDYFKFGEEMPVDPGQRDRQGRTVHLCIEPECTPPASADAAACTLNGPACDATTGGFWNTPPRPLTSCRDPNDLLANPCPETPTEFVSAREVEHIPLLVYVQDLSLPCP